MTEQEWLNGTNPALLIRFLGDRLTSRKFRLMYCHWCRDRLSDFPDERSVLAIGLAERYADGHASEEECQAAREAAEQAVQRWKGV